MAPSSAVDLPFISAHWLQVACSLSREAFASRLGCVVPVRRASHNLVFCKITVKIIYSVSSIRLVDGANMAQQGGVIRMVGWRTRGEAAVSEAMYQKGKQSVSSSLPHRVTSHAALTWQEQGPEASP